MARNKVIGKSRVRFGARDFCKFLGLRYFLMREGRGGGGGGTTLVQHLLQATLIFSKVTHETACGKARS